MNKHNLGSVNEDIGGIPEYFYKKPGWCFNINNTRGRFQSLVIFDYYCDSGGNEGEKVDESV